MNHIYNSTLKTDFGFYLNSKDISPTFLLGTWSLGGFHFGKYDQQNALDVLAKAFELGVRCYDTALFYAKGNSDNVLKKFLKDKQRDTYAICSKAGLYWQNNKVVKDLSKSLLRNTLEDRLRFFGIKFIDMYMLHWPPSNLDIRYCLDELVSLKNENKIKYFGVCNVDESHISVLKEYKCDSIHLKYNPAFLENAKLLQTFTEYNIHSVIFSLFEQGILTNSNYLDYIDLSKKDFRKKNEIFKNSNTISILKRISKFDTFGYSKSICILTWCLAHAYCNSAIIAPRYVTQLNELSEYITSSVDFSVVKSSPYYNALKQIHDN